MSVPVTRIAKGKTAIQMVAIGAMILEPLARRVLQEPLGLAYSMIAYVGLWVAAGLTVYTGYIYFRAGVVHVRPQRAPDTGAGGRA